jgi:hypothetical protein
MTAVNVTIFCFLVLHLGAAIWFASRVNTQVGEISRVLGHMESDIRILLMYDGKIQVLEERMRESAHDREGLRAAVDGLRIELQNLYRDLGQRREP